ncbi:MAG: ABC transporter substrate-binding protein [Polyangiales bacterium]
MSRASLRALTTLCVAACGACGQLLELDDFGIAPASTTRDASSELCTDVSDRCDTLLSEDCGQVVGPADDPRAVRIGSLLSISGPDAQANISREQSVRLAVEELNREGGIPASDMAQRRPLVLITCDAHSNFSRAAQHLVGLDVAAVIGPTASSQIVEWVTSDVLRSRALTISPATSSDSVASLIDADLSWTMVPSGSDRVALLVQQLGELEQRLHTARQRALKLSVIVPNDEHIDGVREALSMLSFNGRPLVGRMDLAQDVFLVEYRPDTPDQSALIDAQLAFRPDIVVLVGGVDTITSIMQPLERAWPQGPERPSYLVSDNAKGPGLLQLAQAVEGLDQRVRGIGVAPTPDSLPVRDAFERRYQQRFGIASGDSAGVSESYDAVYALAYALATEPAGTGGTGIARGLQRLSAGGTAVATGPDDIARALAALSEDRAITALGTTAPLAWDAHGVARQGALEVFCISPELDAYRSAGLRYDVAARALEGATTGCFSRAPSSSQPSAAGSAAAPTRTSVAGAPTGPAASSANDDAGVPEASAPPAPVDIGLAVQYMTNARDAESDVISPNIRLVNRGTQPIPLMSLRVRYYLTNEHRDRCPEGCVVDSFYAGLQPSGDPIRAQRRYVEGAEQSYLEISFGPMSPSLQPQHTVELQQQFHIMPYLPLDQSNDYSWNPRARDYIDWPRVTAHQDHTLVWGLLPTPQP